MFLYEGFQHQPTSFQEILKDF